MQLTERDRKIIRLIHGHRFLRSSHIVDLLDDRSQPVLRRLQLLYHHGYLERPRAQITYYNRGGSSPIIYGLGNKGGAIVRREAGNSSSTLSWGEKNRAIRGLFLEHAILVSDTMVAIELACRKTNYVQFVHEDRLILPIKRARNEQPFQWRVKIQGGGKLGVVPDRVFALEFPNEQGERKRAYFFLEADRGTMPVTRRNLAQTSFYRKLLAYAATWDQSIHFTRFGFNRFRVLTVTTSAARVKSLIGACSRLERGHGLFLFVDRGILKAPEAVLSANWKTGRQGESTTLLN